MHRQLLICQLLVLLIVCSADYLVAHTSTLTEGPLSDQSVIFAEPGNVYICHRNFISRLWEGTEVVRVPIRKKLAAVVTPSTVLLFTGDYIQHYDKYTLELVSEVPSAEVTKREELVVLRESYLAGRSGGRIDGTALVSGASVVSEAVEFGSVLSLVYQSEKSAGGGPNCPPPAFKQSVFDGTYLVALEGGVLTIYNVSNTCQVHPIASDVFTIPSTTVIGLSLGGRHQLVLLLRYDGSTEPSYVATFLDTSGILESGVKAENFYLSEKEYDLGFHSDGLQQQLDYIRLSHNSESARTTVVGDKYVQVWKHTDEMARGWENIFSQYRYFVVRGSGNSSLVMFSTVGHETLRAFFGDSGMLSRLFLLEEKTCTKDGSRTYPKAFHSFQLETFGSQSVGLLLWTILLTCILTALVFIGELFTHHVVGWNPIKAPSTVLQIIQNQYQFLSLSSLVVLLYSLEGGWSAVPFQGQLIAPIALFVLIFCLGIPRYVYVTVINGVVHEKKAVYTFEDDFIYEKRSVVTRFVIGPGEWVPLINTERNWVQKHSTILEPHKQDGVWYCTVEFLVSFLVSLLSSWKAETYAGCGVLKLISCFIMINLSVVQLVYKPFALPRNCSYYPVVNGIQAVGLVFRSASLFLGDINHSLNDIGSMIFSSCEVIMWIKIGIDGIQFIIKQKTGRPDVITRQTWLALQKSNES